MARVSAQPRRTQEMRSAETRRKLILATLESLEDIGYQRTTTLEIARRAGISRGAQVHHFPAKADLVVASAEHLLEEATAEIRELAESVKCGGMTLEGFVDHLWEKFSGRLFFITMEYVNEARHNPRLRENLLPVVRRFHGALDEIWCEFFHETSLTSSQVETILNLTLCLLRGMGVQSVLRDEPRYYQQLLRAWKELLSRIIEVQSDPARIAERARSERIGLLGV